MSLQLDIMCIPRLPVPEGSTPPQPHNADLDQPSADLAMDDEMEAEPPVGEAQRGRLHSWDPYEAPYETIICTHCCRF